MKKLGKKERSREEIMEAARALFEEKDIRHVTFNDIAERAGMSRTTIFNHFATTTDLMMAIVDSELDALSREELPAGLQGRELVYEIYGRLIDEVARYPHMSMRLIEGGISVPEQRVRFAELDKAIMDNLEGDPEEKEKKIIMLNGSFYGLVNYHLIMEKGLDAEELKRKHREYTEKCVFGE